MVQSRSAALASIECADRKVVCKVRMRDTSQSGRLVVAVASASLQLVCCDSQAER
jgi:hypothetical protein